MEFVEHPWINSKTIEKRYYQDAIAKVACTGNTLCVIPTGLGKTNIATLVIADCLAKDSNKKILFMAPTRPLVNQHKKSLERVLKLGLELITVTGFVKPEERARLYQKASIIFATPQTIRNDLKKGVLSLADFSLVVFDEAHRAVGDYAYPYIAKKYNYQAKSPLILALTASPGSFRYKINEVKQKLFIKNVEIRTREDSDVKPYVQELKQEWVTVELPAGLKTIKEYLEMIKNEKMNKLMKWHIVNTNYISKARIIELQQRLARKKTGMSYAAMSLLAEVLKLDHALILLETQSLYSLDRYFTKIQSDKTRAVSRLMKNENFQSAMNLTKKLIKEEKEHPKIQKLREIVSNEIRKNKYANIIIFAQYRDTISRIRSALQDIPNAAPVEFIGQAKKSGKGMSQKEQTEILNEFKLGFYNILVASQIGEEGLDVEETDAVIFYEPIPSAIRKIQRTGRTARTRPGKVMVLITKDTRDEAYHWSGYHKEKKMKKMLYSMKTQKELNDF